MKQGNPRRVAIACQGGGSHAAFTAGVLKKLLTEKHPGHEMVALSGTSGGAVCALLAWYGLLTKGAGEAVQLLDRFWRQDMAANLLPEWLLNEWFVGSVRWQETVGFLVEQSPYYLPDFAKDRLQAAIANNVDFAKLDGDIVKPASLKLYVGAVNALTGEFGVFKSHKPDEQGKPGDDGETIFVFNDSRDDGISAEAILASAAVPFLFRAVHTGEAAYWEDFDLSDPPARIDEGVYWDGLYSQNPPIRDLTDADPDEIWVLQINPEEIGEEPRGGADIRDRRNELAGNISLNQELYFVRKINELVRRFGEYEGDEIKLHGGSGPDKRAYSIITVRRLEMSMPSLSASSKLDRDPSFIDQLISHGEEQATHFLEALPLQWAFETTWEHALRAIRKNEDADQAVEIVMELFTSGAQIEVVPPTGSSACKICCEGKDNIRRWVRWCLEKGFSIEQTRDHRVNGEEITCWMLATADYFHNPVKGWARTTTRDKKIKRFDFYPLSFEVIESIRKV